MREQEREREMRESGRERDEREKDKLTLLQMRSLFVLDLLC